MNCRIRNAQATCGTKRCGPALKALRFGKRRAASHKLNPHESNPLHLFQHCVLAVANAAACLRQPGIGCFPCDAQEQKGRGARSTLGMPGAWRRRQRGLSDAGAAGNRQQLNQQRSSADAADARDGQRVSREALHAGLARGSFQDLHALATELTNGTAPPPGPYARALQLLCQLRNLMSNGLNGGFCCSVNALAIRLLLLLSPIQQVHSKSKRVSNNDDGVTVKNEG